MNLMDFKLTLKDLIQFALFLVAGAFFVFKIQSAQERTTDRLMELQTQVLEMKNEGKSGSKENQMLLQSIQNQINATATQLLVIDQRVSFLEQQIRDRR